jgi:hypothetical protein
MYKYFYLINKWYYNLAVGRVQRHSILTIKCLLVDLMFLFSEAKHHVRACEHEQNTFKINI